MQLPPIAHQFAFGALLPFTPLAAWQGRRVRRTTPRLPDATGRARGSVGNGAATLRIAVIGESTVSGVGARTHRTGITGQLAQLLARKLGARVEWRALGQNGATARRIERLALAELGDAKLDVAFVAIGVNDVLELTPVSRWRSDVARLCTLLASRAGAPQIVFLGLPPMHRFPVLPQPLRAFVGTRAKLLDATLAALARDKANVLHVPTPLQGPPDFFCEDRFHPSEAGYAFWAAHTVDAVVPALGASGKSSRPVRAARRRPR